MSIFHLYGLDFYTIVLLFTYIAFLPSFGNLFVLTDHLPTYVSMQGAKIYFNQPNVKTAIHAPQVEWAEASPRVIYNTSTGLSKEETEGKWTSLTVLPGVIERSKRTIIGHSGLGFDLLRNGTLLSIQNMSKYLAYKSPPFLFTT